MHRMWREGPHTNGPTAPCLSSNDVHPLSSCLKIMSQHVSAIFFSFHSSFLIESNRPVFLIESNRPVVKFMHLYHLVSSCMCFFFHWLMGSWGFNMKRMERV